MNALAILQKLGQGHLIDALAESLVAASEDVVRTGNPATVTLKLKLSTRNVGDPMVAVEEAVTRTVPGGSPLGAYFFSVDGALHRDDPRQTRIDFRTVDRETGEIISPDVPTPTVEEVSS